MKRKCLAVGIILLFVGTCIIPSVTSEKTHGKTIITVDNEPGDADYTSIKEAVNYSSLGDTIEVYSGTYDEHNITITEEGISLIGMPYELGYGNDTGKPFINGQGRDDVINMLTRNVTITGFRIEDRVGYWTIINIGWGADGCVVSNNTLRYAGNSIMCCESNFSKITNNTISDASGLYGILIGYNYNTVADNIIDTCPIGISFWGGSFNTIIRNRVSNCSEVGIDVGNVGNLFQFNTIENNNYGLHIYVASFTRIKQNNFINNTHHAGFDQSLGFTSSNHWAQNYWNRPRILPYPIVGTVFVIMPWVQLDWHPAQEPYDIGGK
jgi:parallel beta-helix repeat protein